MDRPSSPPGGEAAAVGQGCDPGDVVVLTSEGAEVGRTSADPQGGFQTQIVLPADVLGRQPVTAVCSGRTLATSIDIVLATAGGGVSSGAVAALLSFFVVLGLLFFRSPPQAPPDQNRATR
ncbi:MAG: hypothetical protein ACRD1K_09745 [Acidimicrobiales bacterium]